MKKNNLLIYLLLLFTCSLIGCNKTEEEQWKDVKKDSFSEIRLSKQLEVVDKVNIIAKIRILSGNGNYKIVLPKKMWLDGDYIDFINNEVLSAKIDNEGYIVIELKLLDEKMKNAIFMVTDSREMKRIFVVDSPMMVGNLYDFKAMESRLFDDSDYWQN